MVFKIQKVPLVKKNKIVITEQGASTQDEIYREKFKGLSFEEKVFELWSNFTSRPKDLPFTDYAKKKLSKALKTWDGAHQGIIEERIIAASYLPVTDSGCLVIDASRGECDITPDIKRLIDIFEDPSVYKQAKKIRNEINSEPVKYSDISSFSEKLRAIMDRLFVDNFDDLDYLDKQYVSSVASMDTQKFEAFVERLDRFEHSNSHGKESIFKEMSPARAIATIEGKFKNRGAKGKSNLAAPDPIEKERSASKPLSRYEKGRIEHKALGDNLELDTAASSMINEGYNKSDVLAYHQGVPQGYWDSVREFTNSPEASGDPNQAYEALREEFNFHPNDRIRPILR